MSRPLLHRRIKMSNKLLSTLSKFRKSGCSFQIPSNDGTEVQNVSHVFRLRRRIRQWDHWEIRVVTPSGEVVKTFKK